MMDTEYEKAVKDPKRKACIEAGYLDLLKNELRLTEKGVKNLDKGISSLQSELAKEKANVVRLKNEISKSERLQISVDGG